MPGKPYDDLKYLTMSPDGNRIAYEATANQKSFWVVDTTEYSQFTPMGNNFLFSPNSKHYLFTIYYPSDPNQEALVIDGNIIRHYDMISNPVFSNDGSMIAFFASNKNGNTYRIENGILSVVNIFLKNIDEGIDDAGDIATPITPAYPDQTPSDLTLSPHGTYTLYKLSNSNYSNVVINGRLSQTYDTISSSFYFSPDGNNIGFGVRRGNQLWWVVANIVKKPHLSDELKMPDYLPEPPIHAQPMRNYNIPVPFASPYTTFTSSDLGISFSYQPLSFERPGKIRVKQINNSVYLYDTYPVDSKLGNDFSGTQEEFLKEYGNNLHLEVFQKSPQESFESAISEQFLQGAAIRDCNVTFQPNPNPYSSQEFLYQQAQIEISPIIRNTLQPFDFGPCPSKYTSTRNGLNYFLYNPRVPNKFIFVQVGQSDIPGGWGWGGSIQIF